MWGPLAFELSVITFSPVFTATSTTWPFHLFQFLEPGKVLSCGAEAGWRPSDVELIECHATGTPVGDAVEFDSLRQLWAQEQGQASGEGSMLA